MSVEMNLPDETLLMKQGMENKENADSSTWDQVACALEKGLASSPFLKSSSLSMQTARAINCSPDAITVTAVPKGEPAETKNQRMSFSQNFLLKKSTKEKQLKTATQNSSVRLPERRVLGSYRGKIVSSKINSFRKTIENDGRKNSLAAPAKSVTKTEFAKDRVNTMVNASKPINMPSLQTKPPVKVSVCQPKSILNHEKPSKTTLVNKVATQKMPSKNWIPVLKTVSYNAANSEQRAKEVVPPRNETGVLAGSVSETHGTKCVVASKTVGSKKGSLLQSAEVRRSQLAEWQVSKGKALKKPHAPLPKEAQPAIEALQTVKEPVESFWAAIAEEDEQQLFSDTVNKTLTECLCLIEKGCSADKIHSTLEELILSVPQAKKLAKYWVCRIHLEQLGTLEKVMAVYEEAILAGAQPKDELRNALTDILKDIKNVPKSDGECKKKEMILSCTVEEEKVEVQPNNEVKPNNEEASLIEACLKLEQESILGSEEQRIQEQSQTPAAYKKVQNIIESQKNGILEFKTPENNNAGSYLIKYNVSTTPSLESVKKKLQCENSSSAVKDLKLLTPVRRSRRLQGKVCNLPEMLKDHNPCVSSLEQLKELGDETIAFVYRPNAALHNVLEEQDKK